MIYQIFLMLTFSQLVISKDLSRSSEALRLSKRSLTQEEPDFDETGSRKPEIASGYILPGNNGRCLCQKQPVPFYKIINYK